MDFFESQATARRKSRRLIVYFVIAVFLIILTLYAVALVTMRFTSTAHLFAPVSYWHPDVFAVVVVLTLFVIGGGSLFKILVLRRGGPAVAEMLGARPAVPDTRDLKERRFLNVVEEMAIASGTPVPAVYVLDEEPGINAFAAGYSVNDAAVAVTRGALDHLDRDELQGVVAHEFSHILNGDMRLNVRLIGVLHGILLLAIIGRTMFHVSARGQAFAGRRREKSSSAHLLIIGLALLVVGSIGVFFGKLIKSAVSRQREYLADAAAVQFTRNPEGIAGALKKIGGMSQGSRIDNPHADELSHLFFSNALRSPFGGVFSTHPPLEDRIRRLDPSFDGVFPRLPALDEVRSERRETPGVSGLAPERLEFSPDRLVRSVGSPTPATLAYAAALLREIPGELRRAGRDPFEAEALVFALLLDPEPEVRDRQLRVVLDRGGLAVRKRAESLFRLLDRAEAAIRLPLLDLALPGLRSLSSPQYQTFRGAVRELIEADRRVTLFEFALLKILERHLEAHVESRPPSPERYGSLEAVAESAVIVLSAMAHAGTEDPEKARKAFRAGTDRLAAGGGLSLLDPERSGIDRLDTALSQLAEATPPVKKRILEACAACAAHDGSLTSEEAELLRAVAESIDCPMPPVLG
jgi:Zn-dependent protease with chaperone function